MSHSPNSTTKQHPARLLLRQAFRLFRKTHDQRHRRIAVALLRLLRRKALGIR